MGVGKSIIVDLPRDAAEIVVGNPKVANAVVRSARKLYVMGAETGQTTIFAVDRAGRQIANLEISIGRDVGELDPLLKAALPKSKIIARTVNDTIILTGTVASAADAQRAVDIAKGFARDPRSAQGNGASGDGAVVNALTIRGEDQVMLKVTVAEVQRRVVKQLGISAQAGGETILSGGWGKLVQENPFGINSTLTTPRSSINGPNNTNATLKAFERYGVSRTLAEPTVTAVSGEIGANHRRRRNRGAGQLAPASAARSICTVGIIFKPYGVSLNFTPVVLSEGRILLRLATEVTEVDLQNTFTYNQVAVPGFKTRKNETSVEIALGRLDRHGGPVAAEVGASHQRFARSHQSADPRRVVPLARLSAHGDRIARHRHSLHRASASSQEVTRPDDGFVEASDPQAWLLGRVNRLYAKPQQSADHKELQGPDRLHSGLSAGEERSQMSIRLNSAKFKASSARGSRVSPPWRRSPLAA